MPDDTNADFTAFKQCMKIQKNIDIELWDVILWQPLKDFTAWWNGVSDQTKGWSNFLAGTGGLAFTHWIAGVAEISAAQVSGLFAQSLIAVIAGLALGTFMESALECIAQIANA
jgi:hypothetical protein